MTGGYLKKRPAKSRYVSVQFDFFQVERLAHRRRLSEYDFQLRNVCPCLQCGITWTRAGCKIQKYYVSTKGQGHCWAQVPTLKAHWGPSTIQNECFISISILLEFGNKLVKSMFKIKLGDMQISLAQEAELPSYILLIYHIITKLY